MSDRARRPFWIHQFAEYLMGLILISLIFQDPQPEVPVVVGIVMVINAASVRGPLGAFSKIGRRTHRALDMAVVAVCIAGAVQPFVPVTAMGRFALLGILIPYLSSWYYTDWDTLSERRSRRIEQASDRSEALGRGAGRLAGRGWNKVKRTIDDN